MRLLHARLAHPSPRGPVRDAERELDGDGPAAGATAYATGFRTDNHVIAEVPIRDYGVGAPATYRPAGTVLEGAQLADKRTGIVTTTRVTHATPAAFSSHLADRDDENEIAREQVYSLELNVLFGGGRRHFDPSSVAGSARADALDLIADARREGYALVTNATSMRRAAESGGEAAHARRRRRRVRVPRGGVPPAPPRPFAPSHMPYEIDRAEGDVETPTLAEMTGAALEALAPSEAGFFLLVEAGRIDHAGHANDAATAAREVCAYDAAWAVALEFADRHPDVLVVGSSDHDTGGLSVGCCDRYAMDGDALRRQKFSAEYVAYAIIDAYGAARTNGEDVDAQAPRSWRRRSRRPGGTWTRRRAGSRRRRWRRFTKWRRRRPTRRTARAGPTGTRGGRFRTPSGRRCPPRARSGGRATGTRAWTWRCSRAGRGRRRSGGTRETTRWGGR